MQVEKYVISADVGGTNIRAALVRGDGVIIARAKEATGDDPMTVLYRLIDSIYHVRAEEVSGIGVAIAGIIDQEHGILMRSPNMPTFLGAPIRAEISKRYKSFVIIENDSNAAAYGEKWLGAGKDISDFVMLTLGTGVGGGIVNNNELLPVSAEIGHMSISSNGPLCGCGNTGCLESYASATAIVGNIISGIEKGSESILKTLYNGNIYKITAKDIYGAALEGDALSRTVLREAGRHLGIGIANVINMLSPDAIILGGGLIGAWNILIDAAISEASKRAFKELFRKTTIMPSALGDDAGIIGAAALVVKKIRESVYE